MRDRPLLRILLLLSLVVVLGASALAGSAASAPHGPALPRSVLVGFRSNVSPAGQADVLADAGVERLRRYPQIRSALVSVGAQSTAGAIRDLDSDPRVEGSERVGRAQKKRFQARASRIREHGLCQNAMLGFDGAAGQRVTLRFTNVTIGNTSCCGARISMLKPDGANVVPPILAGTFGAVMTATLPVPGRYSIGIDPQQAYTGGITLTLTSS